MALGRKTGGRVKGSVNKSILRKRQALTEAIIASALSPEQLEDLQPLAVMRAIMRERYRAGDHVGALAAAEAAAPYVHAKLSSSDVHITGELADKSDMEIIAERQEIEAKLAAARVVN